MSCPEHLRDELSAQIPQLMMSGGVDAIMKLGAAERRRLARTSSAPDGADRARAGSPFAAGARSGRP